MTAQATPSAPMAPQAAPPAGLARVQRLGWTLGGLGLAACLAGWLVHPEQFFRSYLTGVLLWLGIALGCLGISMLQHLTHGAWGLVVRRVFEAASATLPVLFVLFVPVLLGMQHLYAWSRPEVVAGDALLQAKSGYLNVSFFAARAVLYFAIWIALALSLRRLSLAQDRTGDPRLYHRLRVVSGAGLPLYVLTATFAAIDWLMSLEPHWFSSIYGFQFVGGHAVSALGFLLVVALFLVRTPPMREVLAARHFEDYGKLLLAFVLLWSYFGVSQFLIIWSANLPEEIPWYLHRQHGGWQALSVLLVVFHFALPFLVLLSRTVRRDPRRLAVVGGLVLLMRWCDLYFQAAPTFQESALPHWLDVAAVVGVGGVFAALFARALGSRSLLPVHDPYLPEAVGHG